MGENGAIFGKMLEIPPIFSSARVDSIGLIKSREGLLLAVWFFCALQKAQNKVDIGVFNL
jgi:hypothetical protein